MLAHLDIIGSFIVAGLLLLTLMNVSVGVSETTHWASMEQVAQGAAQTMGLILEADLRRVGYLVPEGNGVFLAADTSNVKFAGDVDDDGQPDTVRYWVGAASEASASVNPNDRVLHRSQNGVEDVPTEMGVTSLQFKYYDFKGLTTSNKSKIRSVRATIAVESAEPYKDAYAQAGWQLRIRPRNINSAAEWSLELDEI